MHPSARTFDWTDIIPLNLKLFLSSTVGLVDVAKQAFDIVVASTFGTAKLVMEKMKLVFLMPSFFLWLPRWSSYLLG
jgi:hypothetical protein